jgi:hypothetical protein
MRERLILAIVQEQYEHKGVAPTCIHLSSDAYFKLAKEIIMEHADEEMDLYHQKFMKIDMTIVPEQTEDFVIVWHK